MTRRCLLVSVLLTACGASSPPASARVEASPRAEPAPAEPAPEAEHDVAVEPAFEPDLAARTLASPPFDVYQAPGTRSFMWADLDRVRLAASDEIVEGVTDALRGLHPDLSQVWGEPRTSPERVQRFAITSMGARNRWVATLVYRAPIRSAFDAMSSSSDNANAGASPEPTAIGPELLAARVAPHVLVLGTARDVRSALATPPQTTPPDLAAEGQLFVWTMVGARRWLATRPRSANPNDLHLVLRLDPDRRFTVEARGPFEDEPAASAAETIWRDRLTALGDNGFVRALAVADLLASAVVDRPEPRLLRVVLRATVTEITALARLFAMATEL